jgi:hypothetical protein
MSRSGNLVRKSFFVDEKQLRRAKKVLGAGSDAEAIRMSLERVAEMERFWALIDRSSNTLEPAAFDEV